MPANRFIRYNNAGPYFEYDTSVAQDGSGPWLLLPIDASQISQGTFGTARIPNLDASKITTGQLALARGGTAVDLSATGAATHVLAQDAAHVISARALIAADIPSLDAAKITSGSFAKAQQHAQTAYKDTANTFAAAGNSFSEILGVAKGIAFPATPVPSADPNTLDDYKEDVFTPTLIGSGGGASAAYSSQAGFFVKKGKEVSIHGFIANSTGAAYTGNMQIGGLPYPSGNVTDMYSAVLIIFGSLAINWIWVGGQIAPNSSVISLVGTKAASASVSALVSADIGNLTNFIFSATYRAAN